MIAAGTFQWDRHPLVNGGPYYPSFEAAVFEILFGRTDIEEFTRIGWENTLNISLADETAYIGEHAYTLGEGLVVDVVEGAPGALAGHEVKRAVATEPI